MDWSTVGPWEADLSTRAAVRLKGKVREMGNREYKDIVEKFKNVMMEKMENSVPLVLGVIDEMLGVENAKASEISAVLEILAEAVNELARGSTPFIPSLQQIAATLFKIKFSKGEKHVERAVVIYLQNIVMLADILGTEETRESVFKIFCTLFLYRTIINSSKCGYIIVPMFREFLAKHPQFLKRLLDNEEILLGCRALLETVVSSYSGKGLNPEMSRVVIKDYMLTKNNSLVQCMQGKGYLETFHYKIYMERETEGIKEIITPMVARRGYLGYLAIDLGSRLNSGNALEKTLDKMFLEGNRVLLWMIEKEKEEHGPKKCRYCGLSASLHAIDETKRRVAQEVAEFNEKGSVGQLEAVAREAGGESRDKGEAQRIAFLVLRLFYQTNLHSLGKFIGKEANVEYLAAYVSTFNFKNMDLLASLRIFLSTFILPGEGQQIERISQAFVNKYNRDNGEGSEEEDDTMLLLAVSIIILNTSLHNTNIASRISCEAFVANILRDPKAGGKMTREYLAEVYESIKTKELQPPASNEGNAADIGMLEHLEEADAELEEIFASRFRGSGEGAGEEGSLPKGVYCRECMARAISCIMERTQLGQRIVESGDKGEIRSFLKICASIGKRAEIYRTVEQIASPGIALELIREYMKEDAHQLWPSLLDTVAKMHVVEKEGASSPSGGSSRFFRNIFLFNRAHDAKKEKEEKVSEEVLWGIVQETSHLPEPQIVDMAKEVLDRLRSGDPVKEKNQEKMGHLLVRANEHRLPAITELLMYMLSAGLLGWKELEALLVTASQRKGPFSELLDVLGGISYRDKKSLAGIIQSAIGYILGHAEEIPMDEEVMGKIEHWMITVLNSDPFRARSKSPEVTQKIVWSKLEEMTLCLDQRGYDTFRILIKIKETLKADSKKKVIENTRMYFKNINRVLLCIDVLKDGNGALEAEFLSTVQSALEQDMEGVAGIIESCENILAKNKALHERVEKKVCDIVIKDAGNVKVLEKYKKIPYLKRIIEGRMEPKADEAPEENSPKQEESGEGGERKPLPGGSVIDV